MDTASKQTSKMLDIIGKCNSELIKLARKLREKPEVVQVKHSLECVSYDDKVLLEGYVDAELLSGKAIAWVLEMKWNEENWHIESSVLVNDEQGQDSILQFPDRIALSLDICLEQLFLATMDLVISIDSIDLIGI